jgi:predicted transport protein
MDHRKEFQWLVMERLGPHAAKIVEWSSPRLICIAGDFTRYDEHAVKQINRNIELLRYRRFGDDLLMIELVHAPKVAKPSTVVDQASLTAPAHKEITPEPPSAVLDNPADPYANQRISYRIANSPPALRDLFGSVSDYLNSLGDDVQVKEVKYYIAFKRIKNFACLEVNPKSKTVTVYLKIDPDLVTFEPGFSRDVRKVGHYGTGDVEVSIRDQDSFARAQPMIIRAYEGN